MNERSKVVCWIPVWNERYPGIGMEQLVASDRQAESFMLGMDEDGAPFRIDLDGFVLDYPGLFERIDPGRNRERSRPAGR